MNLRTHGYYNTSNGYHGYLAQTYNEYWRHTDPPLGPLWTRTVCPLFFKKLDLV